MAESVDALVSNTCGRKAVPVRPRLWVQNRFRVILRRFYFLYIQYYIHYLRYTAILVLKARRRQPPTGGA